MAYISAKDVLAIRNELKAEFPKIKFSVRKESGGLAVGVKVLQGPYEFADTFANSYLGKKYAQVNHYYIKEHFQNPSERKFLLKVNEIMHNAPGRAGGKKYFDESDAMTDYFHTAFYTHLSIGAWDKEYQCVKG